MKRAATYDPEEDEREDAFPKLGAEQSVIGWIKAIVLGFGLKLGKISRSIGRVIRHSWNNYMGYSEFDDLESSFGRDSDRWQQPKKSRSPACHECTGIWMVPEGKKLDRS